MTEIHAHDKIDAQASTAGQDITPRHVAQQSDQPESTTSSTRDCAGLQSPFEDHSFVDDGYVSDGNNQWPIVLSSNWAKAYPAGSEKKYDKDSPQSPQKKAVSHTFR